MEHIASYTAIAIDSQTHVSVLKSWCNDENWIAI